MDGIDKTWISGFWRRVGALFIDSLMLGVLGVILGLSSESIFVKLGAWGPIVGFIIALFYFGIGNSAVTGGQTIGKKLLKLKVVNGNNSSIGVGRSIFRYFIFATPFFLNGEQFSNEAMQSVLIYPLSIIIFGGLVSIVYLYVCNRATRQSLHDLAVGTFVVNVGAEQQDVGKVWNIHIAIVVLLFLTSAIGPAFTAQLSQTEPFKEMVVTQLVLLKEANVSYATISTNRTTTNSLKEGTKTTTSVSSQVFLESNKINDAEFARRIVDIVTANYPDSRNKDVILITLTYGYDIGIWSQWSSHTYTFWSKELQGVE